MTDTAPHCIASFHLVRDASRLRTMARLGLDRRRLRRVPGLVFWRLLGTGAGSDTGPGADLQRSALFAIWKDVESLDAFEASMADRWSTVQEVWSVRLRGWGGHGAWHGVDVLGLLEPAVAPDATGPVAIITRANVRRRSWRSFRQVGPAVSAELNASDGLLGVVGIGEAPFGRLGTFSLWASIEAARAFALQSPHHREVVRRTRTEGWYGEELFARFEPTASAGRWNGHDPLAP
ncbi:MAG: spheroidene monooxygenase [Actinomycetota bacterium]